MVNRKNNELVRNTEIGCFLPFYSLFLELFFNSNGDGSISIIPKGCKLFNYSLSSFRPNPWHPAFKIYGIVEKERKNIFKPFPLLNIDFLKLKLDSKKVYMFIAIKLRFNEEALCTLVFLAALNFFYFLSYNNLIRNISQNLWPISCNWCIIA